MAYETYKEVKNCYRADKVLENSAWQRVTAKDNLYGEKAAAYLVTNMMKVKRKLGMGIHFNLLINAGWKVIRKTNGKLFKKISSISA